MAREAVVIEPSSAAPDPPGSPSGSGLANRFGLGEAVLGLVAGVIVSTIAVALFGVLSHHPRNPSTYGSDVASLLGLWIGLVGAPIVASRTHRERWRRSSLRTTFVNLRDDYGLALRPWPDLALGVVVGFAGQFILVPLLELLLVPFVPHLFKRLGEPARSLTSGVSGPGLFLLGVLICFGSPLVEELFFRGLFLRGLLGRFANLGPKLAPVMAIVSSGMLFGLVHFEPLQLIGLVGLGIMLGILALKTGRLGPGIVAHIAFNATTFVALAWH